MSAAALGATRPVATPLATVLIVDDEPLIVRALERLLRRSFTVLTVATPQAALETVSRIDVAAVLSDQRMPGMGGADLIAAIRRQDPRVMGLLITAYADIDAAAAAINDAGVIGYLRKPWRDEQVLEAVHRAVSAHNVIRSQAQQRSDLRQQEEAVRVLIDNAPLAVALLGPSPEFALLRYNAPFSLLIPPRSGPLEGSTLSQLLADPSSAAIDALCGRASQTGDVVTSPELEWTSIEGHVRHVACTISPLGTGSEPGSGSTSESGSGLSEDRYVLTAVDLTATVASREEARNAAARQTAILEQLPSGVVVVDSDGHTVVCNDIARRLEVSGLDRAPEESASGPRDALTGRGMRADELPLARALAGERVTNLDYRQDLTDGADSWIRASAAPLLGPQNEVSGAVAVCTDVTSEHLADQARTIALASASHELRTPLTAALGFAGLLMGGELGPLADKQVVAVGRIQASMERLHLLVEDIMDLSTIESGHSDLRPSPVDIGALLARVVDSFSPQLQHKHQELELERAPGAIVAWADERRLEQVVTNLVSNAHKYTLDGGRIIIRAAQDDAGILVTVTDTGVGLTREEISNLCTKFYRARNPATWNVPGTGLGLAICRALIEGQGGTMSISSKPGKGSTFGFRLPPERQQPTLTVTAEHRSTEFTPPRRLRPQGSQP